MNKYLIHVTDEHIKNGRPMEPESCPIALAITDELHPDHISVNAFDVVMDFTEKSRWKFWEKPRRRTLLRHLPSSAQAFVINFDAYNDKEISRPFTFELEV